HPTHTAQEARAPQPLAFTVVPFRNATQDTTFGFRSDGIGDEILTAMSKVPGVQIVGRSMARRYIDRDTIDERVVQRQSGAHSLVPGAMPLRGGRLTVSPQLHDSITRGEIWAGSVDRPVSEFGSVSGEIARMITDALRARYANRIGEPQQGALAAGTTNGAA